MRVGLAWRAGAAHSALSLWLGVFPVLRVGGFLCHEETAQRRVLYAMLCGHAPRGVRHMIHHLSVINRPGPFEIGHAGSNHSIRWPPHPKTDLGLLLYYSMLRQPLCIFGERIACKQEPGSYSGSFICFSPNAKCSSTARLGWMESS